MSENVSKRYVPGDIRLQIDSAYYNMLDIPSFALMLKDPSFCYKFYWLEAIVGLISEGVTQTTFDAIIDEMICNAWYSVREFHIHLSGLGGDGSVLDGLERAVLTLSDLSELPANASRVEIRNEIRDIFTGRPMQKGQYDIDHFIPWSFVMNDELWNLMPMDLSLNSAKSNRLPLWDPFFKTFSDNQYILYQLIQEQPGIHKLYEGCWRDNMHSIWAGQELYRPGNNPETFKNILGKNMLPVYDAARRQGYEMWQMR